MPATPATCDLVSNDAPNCAELYATPPYRLADLIQTQATSPTRWQFPSKRVARACSRHADGPTLGKGHLLFLILSRASPTQHIPDCLDDTFVTLSWRSKAKLEMMEAYRHTYYVNPIMCHHSMPYAKVVLSEWENRNRTICRDDRHFMLRLQLFTYASAKLLWLLIQEIWSLCGMPLLRRYKWIFQRVRWVCSGAHV